MSLELFRDRLNRFRLHPTDIKWMPSWFGQFAKRKPVVDGLIWYVTRQALSAFQGPLLVLSLSGGVRLRRGPRLLSVIPIGIVAIEHISTFVCYHAPGFIPGVVTIHSREKATIPREELEMNTR